MCIFIRGCRFGKIRKITGADSIILFIPFCLIQFYSMHSLPFPYNFTVTYFPPSYSLAFVSFFFRCICNRISLFKSSVSLSIVSAFLSLNPFCGWYLIWEETHQQCPSSAFSSLNQATALTELVLSGSYLSLHLFSCPCFLSFSSFCCVLATSICRILLSTCFADCLSHTFLSQLGGPCLHPVSISTILSLCWDSLESCPTSISSNTELLRK